VATTSIEEVRIPAMRKGWPGATRPDAAPAPRQAHRLRRVAHVGIDLAHADVGVGEDGRDGEDEQRQKGGQEATHLSEIDGWMARGERASVGPPGGVGRVHRHQAAAAGVAEYEADAAAHHQRTEHHGERELGLA